VTYRAQKGRDEVGGGQGPGQAALHGLPVFSCCLFCVRALVNARGAPVIRVYRSTIVVSVRFLTARSSPLVDVHVLSLVLALFSLYCL